MQDIGTASKQAGAWVENWHNSELRFCDVPEEHRGTWLDETFRWLGAGKRWPLSPTDRMVRHCIHWWPRVVRVMMAHGWWPECTEDDLVGYVITWHFSQDGQYKLSHGAPQAHYAGICGASIARRKARYYGLWKQANH